MNKSGSATKVLIIKKIIKELYWNLPFSNEFKRRVLNKYRARGVFFFIKKHVNYELYKLYAEQILNSPRNIDFHSSLSISKMLEKSDFTDKKPKLIAYYLTQFHPTTENDAWWGRGITEWNNVFRAVPQFLGHYQPRIPGELGAYDLRLVENIKRQVELAKLGGLYGFAFYYYWFNGKTLLRKPLDIFIENKDIDFPFMLCWANESWTKRFDGTSQDELMTFTSDNESNLNFISDAKIYITDDRYIRLNGKPIIQIYKPSNFDDIKSLISYWRESAKKLGIGEIHLMAVLFGESYSVNWKELGFDSANDFQPGSILSQSIIKTINNDIDIVNQDFCGQVYSYDSCVDKVIFREEVYPAVMPCWDNSARRIDSGLVFHDATPIRYSVWLNNSIKHTISSDSLSGNFVFINAWNEWGEGAYLEPDKKYGYSYLNVTRKIVDKYFL